MSAMGTSICRSRSNSPGGRSVATALLLLWFLVGHPLALYADTLDDLDGPSGAEELSRKTRADVAAPLPDLLQAADDEGRRLQIPWATIEQWGAGAALAATLQVNSTLALRRLSRQQSPPLLFPLQVAPPSCPDGEPPHAG